MKIQILSPETHVQDADMRAAMFRHRAKLFADTLQWDNLNVANGEERDEVDGDPCVEYVVTVDDSELVGSCRLVPMSGTALLTGPLKHYFDGVIDADANAWEVSRFAPATDPRDRRHGRSFALIAAGVLELCLKKGVRELYGIGDPQLMGLASSLGARVTIEGPPVTYAPGKTAFAFKFPVDEATLHQVMTMQGLTSIPHVGPTHFMVDAA